MMATLSGLSRIFTFGTNKVLTRIGRNYLDKLCYPGNLAQTRVAEVHYKLPWIPKTPDHQVEIPDCTAQDEKLAADVTKAINDQITNNRVGRLFAIVQLCGRQIKVTESDIIIVEGYWPPNPGDQLKLEKVLLVGGTDFTLIGRPILNRELVSVDATVIEKSMSHTKTHFRFRKRKQYRRINFYRMQHTMLRINSIDINGKIDEKKPVEGLDRIY